MTSQINNAIKLKDLVASEVVNNNLTTTKSQALADETNRVLLINWEALKSISIKMQIETLYLENQVICQCQGPGESRKQVLEKNIRRLFKELTEKCDTKSTFGDILPISLSAYEHLQKKWENEALLHLWEKIYSQLGPVAPLLQTPDAIRGWLSDAANAPALANITDLDLSQPYVIAGERNTDKEIKVIPPEIRFCTQLQTLSLAENQISSIPPEIGLCTQLQSLNLSGNQILLIPPEIKFCTQLQRLDLNHNRILSIPSEIGLCTQLQELRLNDNQIASIPPAIGFCTQLQKLWLKDNQIASIPPAIGLCTQLQELWLNNNLILSIPFEIGLCTQLQELLLDGNLISLIPPEIGFCTRLLRLSLAGNRLSLIPSEIGFCTQLRYLYLNANLISSIPPEIGFCTDLQKLYLSANLISSIPSEIGFCTELEGLYLNANLISSIPSEIGFCTELEELYLNANLISSIPSEIGSCTKLEKLRLHNNPIFLLPSQPCTTLQEHYLSNNQQTLFIPAEILSYVKLSALFCADDGMSVFLIETDKGNSDVRYITRVYNTSYSPFINRLIQDYIDLIRATPEICSSTITYITEKFNYFLTRFG
jgi:Leucine-rich repeat (LRR) protein